MNVTTHTQPSRPARRALAVFGVTLAQANAGHKFTAHKVTALVKETEISQTGTVPAAGSTITNAGTHKSNLGGNGAEANHLTVTGLARGRKIGFTGKGTSLFAHGSVTYKIKCTATPSQTAPSSSPARTRSPVAPTSIKARRARSPSPARARSGQGHHDPREGHNRL